MDVSPMTDAHQPDPHTDRASGRPLGLSIAFVAGMLLYSFLPLLQIALIVITGIRISGLQFVAPTVDGNDLVDAIAVGGDFLGASPASLILQAAAAVSFLVISVFAWNRRGSRIRAVYVVAVLAMTAFTLASTALRFAVPPTFTTGLDSGAMLQRQTAGCGLMIQLIVPLYVLWYVNRAPARAFFRGRAPARVDELPRS
jgi:hypothetical protein